MTAEGAQRLRAAADRIIRISERALSGDADREELDEVIAELRAVAVREFGARPAGRKGQGARARIREHLKAHLGEWVHGEELAAISGIQEWARRVRELRVEQGYEIEEEDGRYRLTSPDPDVARAERWRLANRIRRSPGSGLDRIRRYLIENEGRVVTRDELDYVARIKEGSRRLRELRDEKGYPIESHIEDPSLRPGEYRLASAAEEDRRDPRQRLYPENLRERVFARDGYTCRKCGRDREAAEKAGDRRFYLEIHHKKAVAEQLDGLPSEELNDESNLVTYCHRCHVEETARLQAKRRRERRVVADS